MDDEVQYMLLTLENFVLLCVYYQRSIIAFFLDVLAFDFISYHVKMTGMVRHVRCQDHVNDTFTYVNLLCIGIFF